MWLSSVALAMPLHRALDDVLDDPALRGASVGVVVLGADGDVLYAHDPDRRLVPASTAKWVTAAAVLAERGLAATYETGLYATGELEGDVLHGDVVVAGVGDPSLGEPDPRALFATFAAFLREQGIARVAGDLVVDTSAIPGPGLGPGWMWDDLALAFSPRYGAANVGHNVLVAGLEGCDAQDGPGSPLVDPGLCLAQAARDGLAAAGVPVDGAARRGSVGDGVLVGVVRSPPLGELARRMLVESDNLYAECLAHGLDRQAVLAAAGAVDTSLVDGSGLSRYSAVTARDLASVARWTLEQPWGTDFLALLPVSGRDGTLARRTLGTPAEGRVRGKTGSMTGVRNLVGAVDAVDERLVVAFLVNGLAAPQAEAIAVQDRALSLLASSRRGRVPRRTVDLLLGHGYRRASWRAGG